MQSVCPVEDFLGPRKMMQTKAWLWLGSLQDTAGALHCIFTRRSFGVPHWTPELFRLRLSELKRLLTLFFGIKR